MSFVVLPHTADLKIRVCGKTLKDLFCNALIAMFQSIKPQAKKCYYKNELFACPALPQEHNIHIKAENVESLLIDFLSEALYLSDVHNEAYLNSDIFNLDETSIDARIYGVKIDGFNVEIKAVTYSDFRLIHKDDKWCVEIVFDI